MDSSMRNADLRSSLFLAVLSVLGCVGSFRLGIGTMGNPGMGFTPFGISTLLGIGSTILFFQALFRGRAADNGTVLNFKAYGKVIIVLLALTIYAALMPTLGYLLSTFPLMFLLFWIVRGEKWIWVFPLSFLATIISYLVFSVWLNCQFPKGLLGF